MTTCRPPTCGTYRIDVVDRRTGTVIHRLERTSQWTAQWTTAENATPTIQIEMSTDADCCSLPLVPWRHEFKVYRDNNHCMSYLFQRRTPVAGDAGQRVVTFVGVSYMWVLIQRLWMSAIDSSVESTVAFTRLLDEADSIDPLGLFREPIPVGQNVDLLYQVGDPLAVAFNQLTSGTLEWVEYGLDNGSQAVRYGNTAYNTGITISNDWWLSPVEPSQDGATLASVVRVQSEPDITEGEETELVVGWYPPLESNGAPNRGSHDMWLPKTFIIPGLTTEAEATAVAKRIWEKSQNPDYLEDASNSLTRQASGFCPCRIQPGAIFNASLDTECAEFATELRLTQLTVTIESGKEISVSPTLIAGQA